MTGKHLKTKNKLLKVDSKTKQVDMNKKENVLAHINYKDNDHLDTGAANSSHTASIIQTYNSGLRNVLSMEHIAKNRYYQVILRPQVVVVIIKITTTET